MSFTFKFAIDYSKLNTMLDTFLKEHDKELTTMVGKCLTIQKDEELIPTNMPIPMPEPTLPRKVAANNDYFDKKIQQQEQQIDHKVDNRPIIGDDIPEDPFANMFSKNKNPNANTTRIGDRNIK